MISRPKALLQLNYLLKRLVGYCTVALSGFDHIW